MNLQAYLDRIGYAGPVRVDLPTLAALHRHHLRAIPYENLDVQLGRPLDLDPAAAFEKLVVRRRGGWCYEMNGLFGAMLEQAGFQVTYLAGAVLREQRGPEAVGNHLVLRVDLDRPYLADVGFGDGMIEPTPLTPGPFESDGYGFRLETRHGGWWRFHNHAEGGVPYFDFTLDPADPERLSSACQWLQTSPESVFVQTAVCQRLTDHGVIVLLGRALRLLAPDEPPMTILKRPEELLAALRTHFGLDVPDAATLWPKICARHDAMFPPRPATA
jgi:N-hydroxyarylamine O-acetyltransferase